MSWHEGLDDPADSSRRADGFIRKTFRPNDLVAADPQPPSGRAA